MKLNDLYPSKWLKASDLQGREVPVTIAAVTVEDLGDGRKPAAWFAGKQKGLVLNVTNAGRIAKVYGDDTDHWPGANIVLYSDVVSFQGRTVDAIRVRVPQQPGAPVAAAVAQKHAAAVAPPAEPAPDEDGFAF